MIQENNFELCGIKIFYEIQTNTNVKNMKQNIPPKKIKYFTNRLRSETMWA